MSTLSVLTGPGAPALVREVLAREGLRAVGAVELHRIHYRPGADTTVSFTAAVPGGGPLRVLLTDAEVDAPLLPSPMRLRGWLHPADPALPGLRLALAPGAVDRWLGGHPDPARAAPELLSYRPLRGATVRVRFGGVHFYVKVWRPDASAAAAERYRLMDAAGLGPPVLAEPEPGLLVVGDADGVPLTRRLADWSRLGTPLPDPGEVVRLLDRLPSALLRFPEREAWSDRADFHGAAAAALLPDRAEEVALLVGRLARLLVGRPPAPRVPTHGDFYEANVLEIGGRLTSVVDLETAGPGRRVDDLACLLGHLAVLPDLSPAHYGRVADVTRRWAAAFERSIDATELRARTAGVILSLVAGSERPHALARLALGREWLDAAEAARPR